jgi:hypothetical protein
MKCQRIEYHQTYCIPPPQQHFQSPQSFFSRHNHRPVLPCKVRYIEHLLNMRLQYEIIGNRLYSPLPIRQRSVTDLSSPLLIGHWSVTDFTSPLPIGLTFLTSSFNIHYKELLTQNMHLAQSTQQAEQAGFTREEITRRASQFSWKLTNDKVVKFQSLELAGWYQTVPYLRL